MTERPKHGWNRCDRGLLQKIAVLAVPWLSGMVVSLCLHSAFVCGQDFSARELPDGMQRISGQYIDVITDMPLNEALRELPRVFDAAIPIWCEAFGMQVAEVQRWHVAAYVMLDRQRFANSGLLPPELAAFPHGFQNGDRLWVSEQPSDYYRRHLLLHEGTHWFMTRKYGRHGPPWLMEGMAEWLGTHRWDGQSLELGIIPQSSDDAPYWGRIKLIKARLAAGEAPPLEDVLRYSETAHREVEAYAWSWAAVCFFNSDRQARPVLTELLERPMQSTGDTNRWLFRRLRAHWPGLRESWSAILSELDYGYDAARSEFALSPDPRLLSDTVQCVVKADRGWQSTNIFVPANAQIEISAEGMFQVAQRPSPWDCSPEGVTLEYVDGQPLGRLLMTIVAPIEKEPPFARELTKISVGSGGRFIVPVAGEIQFRINETSRGLADNSGSLNVTIRP